MLINMLNKFNPFKGSQCEDNLEENCTKTFEETHAEDKSFTFISSNAGIPKIHYVVSTSEVTYNIVRNYVLEGGKCIGEYLPWILRSSSQLVKYTEDTNISIGNTTINLEKLLSATMGFKIADMRKDIDVGLDYVGPICKKVKTFCSETLIDDAIRNTIRIGLNLPDVEGDKHWEEISDEEVQNVRAEPNEALEEIDEAKDYANPNTNVQEASFVQSGPIHQRVAS